MGSSRSNSWEGREITAVDDQTCAIMSSRRKWRYLFSVGRRVRPQRTGVEVEVVRLRGGPFSSCLTRNVGATRAPWRSLTTIGSRDPGREELGAASGSRWPWTEMEGIWGCTSELPWFGVGRWRREAAARAEAGRWGFMISATGGGEGEGEGREKREERREVRACEAEERGEGGDVSSVFWKRRFMGETSGTGCVGDGPAQRGALDDEPDGPTPIYTSRYYTRMWMWMYTSLHFYPIFMIYHTRRTHDPRRPDTASYCPLFSRRPASLGVRSCR